MEDNNNMQDDNVQGNESIFGNMNSQDEDSKKDLYEGLDSDTFGKVENKTEETDTTVYTSTWNPETYVPGSQTNYYNAETSAPEKKQSKALEICALVFGILSLCGCCYGLFGLIGLVLSIIALAKGKKSGLSITGLVLSIIGIIGALAWTIFCFSSAGQEFTSSITESFVEGFEEGYNGTDEDVTTEATGDESEDAVADVTTDTESAETTDSATVVSSDSATMGKVTIDGKEITIPVKLSEVKNEFEISDMSKEDLEGALEVYDMKVISLASDGKTTGASLVVSNYSDEDIADINDAYVTGVGVDSYGEVTQEVKFYKDIAIGMSKTELEAALEGIEYDKDATENYDYYTFYLGENSDFYFSIYVTDDKVDEVLFNYYGECE